MSVEYPDRDMRIDMASIRSAIWQRRVRIAAVTAAALIVTFVILLFVPKMYESSASLLVEPRESAYLSATNDPGNTASGSYTDTTAVASHIQLIESRDNLLSVIDSENLRDEPELNGVNQSPLGMLLGLFGKGRTPQSLDEIVLANVNSRLTVIQERDSRIITILFRSESPQLAARVANAIAKTHVKRRAGLVLADTADATKWLETEIDKLRGRVAEAEAKVAAYRVNNDLFVGSNNVSLVDQQLSGVSSQIQAAQERKSAAQSKATVLRSLIKAGQPLDGAPAVKDSQTIQQLIQEKGTLTAQRAQKLSTLLPNHPDVQALTAQIDEIDRQIVAEARKVADALDAEASVEADVEQSLRDELARLKLQSSGATKSTVELNQLEREAKAQRDLLETYLARYRDASARTDASSALPDVRVVSVAAPSVNPASPKTALILLAVFIVALVGQLGYLVFAELLSGRSIVIDQAEIADVSLAAAEVQVRTPARRKFGSPVRAQAAQEPEDEPDDELETEPSEENADEQAEAEVVPAPVLRRRGAEADYRQMLPVWRDTAPKSLQGSNQPATAAAVASDIGALVDDIVEGKEHIVFVATLGGEGEADAAVDRLMDTLLERETSVVLVDASSGETSAHLGLTDLCAGEAGFGDVVHRSRNSNVGRVPWGQEELLDHRSAQAATLVEALSDVYDAVIVTTGRPGVASSLPLFAGAEGCVLLASPSAVEDATLASITEDVAALGFDRLEVVEVGEEEAQVA